MKIYTLKLKTTSTVNYNLYDGTTLVSDSDLTTLFSTAGEAYFQFDFDEKTPTNITSLTILNSQNTAIITNTGLTGITENKNFKGTWAASATAFATFTALGAVAMDEAELSFLMSEVKNGGGGGEGGTDIKIIYAKAGTVNTITGLYSDSSCTVSISPADFYTLSTSGKKEFLAYLMSDDGYGSISSAGGFMSLSSNTSEMMPGEVDMSISLRMYFVSNGEWIRKWQFSSSYDSEAGTWNTFSFPATSATDYNLALIPQNNSQSQSISTIAPASSTPGNTGQLYVYRQLVGGTYEYHLALCTYGYAGASSYSWTTLV